MHRNFWWEKPLGRRPLESQRRRLNDNTKMDYREFGFQDSRWIYWCRIKFNDELCTDGVEP
jgi:hypothetical protein